MSDAERWLSSGQVAALLGVHRVTITRMGRNRLPYTLTPGGQRRYRREDVEAFRRELEEDDRG